MSLFSALLLQSLVAPWRADAQPNSSEASPGLVSRRTAGPLPALTNGTSSDQSLPFLAAAGGTLRIVDCQGFTRAMQSAEPGQLSRVEVSVSSQSPEPVEVELKQVGNNFSQRVVSQNGLAVFENVPPGTFEISVSDSAAEVGAIAIGASTFGTMATSAVGVGAAVAVAGGATGAVVGLSEVIDSLESNNSPDSTPTPAPPSPPPPVDPTPIPSDDCAVCDPDTEPPPLDQDDFFPAQSTQQLSPSS
jgi:hypothetical protein